MANITLTNISKRFGAKTVLDGITLEIRDSEFLVFVGPSGCGKSTLLRSIAGFETPDEGEIIIDGKVVTHLPPGEREIAMVFQSYALYPHMTAAENLSFCLKNTGVPKVQIEKRLSEIAKVLQIESLLDRKPHQMSGGQRQRVAIGRAIIRNPKVYLFDEPLSNLDALLRGQTRVELAALHQQFKTTTIYVTHDQIEAMTLADRIAVMNSGRIEQVGAPLEIYYHPANTFVGGFIGSPPMNFLPAVVVPSRGGRQDLVVAGQFALPAPIELAPDFGGGEMTAGIRAEDFRLEDGRGMRAQVEVVEHLGSFTLLYCRTVLPQGESKQVVVQDIQGGPNSRILKARPGDTIRLGVKTERVYLFGPNGQALTADKRHYAETA